MRPIVTNVSWSLSVPNRLSRSFGLWTRVWHRSSGVETGSSGGSMNLNRGPQAAGGPKWGQKNFTKMCEMTHLQSTRRVFSSRRGHLRINTESVKTLGGWGPHLGSLHCSPGPVACTPRSCQHLGLPAWALGAKATEGTQVTVEPGPCSKAFQFTIRFDSLYKKIGLSIH